MVFTRIHELLHIPHQIPSPFARAIARAFVMDVAKRARNRIGQRTLGRQKHQPKAWLVLQPLLDRLGLGLMRTFQIPKLFDDMTVYENLLVPALSDSQIGRRSYAAVQAQAEHALAFSKLSQVRHNLAKEISGGQKMLLQILRGFMVPDLPCYVMDEPFTGINPALKDIIIEAILTMNQVRGITFILISHKMPTIRNMCSTISVRHLGRLIAEGPLEQVAGNPAVIEAYLGGTDVFTDH